MQVEPAQAGTNHQIGLGGERREFAGCDHPALVIEGIFEQASQLSQQRFGCLKRRVLTEKHEGLRLNLGLEGVPDKGIRCG